MGYPAVNDPAVGRIHDRAELGHPERSRTE